ncbi:hypothetical protein [Bacillus sp. FSL R12-0069]|uniref:hypothetical protein n=1 Tax=Bacillus sp. FSL R12-0069 TaxID=2975342 RepID=UPI0030FD187C
MMQKSSKIILNAIIKPCIRFNSFTRFSISNKSKPFIGQSEGFISNRLVCSWSKKTLIQ